MDIVSEVKHIIAPSKALFTKEQSESSVDLIRRAALLDGDVSAVQAKLLDEVSKELLEAGPTHGKWS